MDRNTLGWLLLVVSVIVIGFSAYTVQAEILTDALGLSTLVWSVVIVAGLFGVYQGIVRLDNPQRGFLVALGLFVVFMVAAFVCGWRMTHSGDQMTSFSFYIMDGQGRLVRVMPKSAFGLFSLWAGDTELHDQFSIVYDCTAHVTGSPVKPQYLSFSQRLYVKDASTGKWISATGAKTTSKIANRYTTASWNEVVRYHTSGWVSDGANRWKIDVGKASKLVAATVSKSDSLWNINSKLVFQAGIVAETNVGGTVVRSTESPSPMFEIEKKGDPITAVMWLSDVHWGTAGEELPSGGRI